MLDFTPLTKATSTLASALQETATRPNDLLARDGCIQRFEYTYELCVKSLRRQLEELADSPAEIDSLGYKDMLRVAVERGLIADALPWFGFRELRNITSHAYDPDKAAQVFAGIPAFLASAQQLLAHLAPQGKGIEWDAP
jgi:nucleotidyltransferase substrate binding protein (TIGR01987 family)